MGFGLKGIGHIWLYNNGSIKCCSQPDYMSMPPHCASLSYDYEIVGVALSSLNRALGDICRSLNPTGSELPDPMPVHGKYASGRSLDKVFQLYYNQICLNPQ